MIKSYHIDPNTSTNQFLIRSESIPSSIFTSQHQRNTICDNTSHSESFRIMDTQNKQSQSQLLPSLSMPRFNINDNINSIKSDNEQNKHSDDKDTYIMTNKTEESEDNDSQNHHNNNNVGYINVDQVQSPPGPDFIEWKRITKQLLKVHTLFSIIRAIYSLQIYLLLYTVYITITCQTRENELMKVRCDVTKNIINKV